MLSSQAFFKTVILVYTHFNRDTKQSDFLKAIQNKKDNIAVPLKYER